MQGIDSREYRNVLDVFHKYQHLSFVIPKIESNEDAKIRKDMAELTVLYDRFTLLLAELKSCVRDYELKKKETRSILHRGVRKLIVEKK